MPITVMEHTGADSRYLHRDFHLILNRAMQDVGQRYGEDGVRAWIRSYAIRRFSPMTMEELQAYFQSVYRSEEAGHLLQAEQRSSCLRVRIAACPAVRYIREQGEAPCPWYVHTVQTLYATIAEICGFGYALDRYDPQTGAAEMRFFADGKEERT